MRVGNFWSDNYIEYESNGDRNKTLSIKEYFDEIKPNLKDKNDLKKSDRWKTQLTMAINFVSSKDTEEEREIYSKSYNIEIIIYDIKQTKLSKNLLNHFLIHINWGWKHQ